MIKNYTTKKHNTLNLKLKTKIKILKNLNKKKYLLIQNIINTQII